MTEEEKLAIEFLETTRRSIIVTLGHEGTGDEWAKEELKHLNAILNLIDKLQKENEELNNRDTSRLSEIGRLRTKNNYLEKEAEYYYIPKYKIRSKREQEEKLIKSEIDYGVIKYREGKAEALRELLEEE